MAGLSLLFIGLCAKDLGPIEHGKQGEKASYLFLATILILDGLLAPSEVAVSGHFLHWHWALTVT